MKLAKLPNGDGYGRDYQCVFGGLNENLAARDGEVRAMENMTSDHYPLLSPRSGRYRTGTLAQPWGMAARDRLCWADGTDFYYDGAVKGQVEAGPKRFYFLNNWVVIWPDKKYYNPALDEFGSLETAVTVDGAAQKAIFCSSAAPGGISSQANCLRFDGVTLQGRFQAGEAVTISGCGRHPENNLTLVVKEAVGTALYFYDNSFTLDARLTYTVPAAGLRAGCYNFSYAERYYNLTLDAALAQGDVITFDGENTVTAVADGEERTLQMDFGAFGEDGWLDFDCQSLTYAEEVPVTVSRKVPELDFLCQCDNRLWGVKDSTVCCSYLGNPRIWYNYEGTATGCWSVEVGSGGAFTGACAYGGYPLLFKEDHIYRVYGTKPANFQLMDTETLGCEAGSEKSFAVAGQTLYYKSRAGFVAYAGGVPSIIDGELGPARRQNAVAGTDGRKYYVSVDSGEGRGLYVYDTVLGLWHREDGAPVMDFAWCGGELYMLLETGEIYMTGRVREPVGTAEGDVRSMAEFGDFYGGAVEKKTLGRLYFRVQTAGELGLFVSYDGGPWQEAGRVYGAKKGVQTLRLVPRRCDSFRVRLEGVGDWKLWAMSREYFTGSAR